MDFRFRPLFQSEFRYLAGPAPTATPITLYIYTLTVLRTAEWTEEGLVFTHALLHGVSKTHPSPSKVLTSTCTGELTKRRKRLDDAADG